MFLGGGLCHWQSISLLHLFSFLISAWASVIVWVCAPHCFVHWSVMDDGTFFKFRGLYWKFLVRVVELVSSLVLLTREQLVCCGGCVGLGVGLCPELLLRQRTLSSTKSQSKGGSWFLVGRSVAGSIIDIMLSCCGGLAQVIGWWGQPELEWGSDFMPETLVHHSSSGAYLYQT